MNEVKNIPRLRFSGFEDEWKEYLLSDISKFSKGKGLSKSDILENGKFSCIRYGELYTEYNEVINTVISKTNYSDNPVLSEENDVIIPASGETSVDIATASCVKQRGIILGGDLNIIKTQIDGVFLSYYLNNKRKFDIARLSQGNSVVHLYPSQLKTLKINIPSTSEVIKIADFLTAVDKRIELLEKKKTLLETHKKGVMKKIFNQEIRFKDENGNDFPEWKKKRLEEVFKSEKGKGLSKDKVSEQGLFKSILYGELYTTYNEVAINIKSFTDFDEGTKSKIGDLLVPCSTTTSNIDLANVTAIIEDGIRLGGDITILRNKSYEIDNIFYSYYLSNHKKFELAKFGQGTTIVHLYYNHFKKMIIDIPSLKEQLKISKFLFSIDTQIELLSNQIVKSKTWKKGLHQKMFV